MKLKHVIILMGLFLLHSCIVKSINPFYTEDKIITDKRLEGEWQSKKASWKIVPFKDKLAEEGNNTTGIFNIDSSEQLRRYENTYVVRYKKEIKDNNMGDILGSFGWFLVTAFKVEDDVFLDFIPMEYNVDENSLVFQHIFNTHTVCKVDFEEDTLQFKWLTEDVVGELIENHKLKIKYEITGYDDDLVLTAKSKELYRFLEKFMASSIKNKWDDDQTYTLTAVDGQ